MSPVPRPNEHPRRALAVAATLSLVAFASRAVAQIDVEFRLARSGDPEEQSTEDHMPPRLTQDPDLDRYLRKAEDFVAREEWDSAIVVLQRVIEGDTGPEADEQDPGADSPTTTPPEATPETSIADAVYSSDGRLHRPVRELCQELLSDFPPPAVALYRARFEVAAERAFEAARKNADPSAMQAVFDRFPACVTAGRALRTAADMRLDRGAIGAALRDYLRLGRWPDEAREEAGIDDSWLQFRIALCQELLGRSRQRDETLAQLDRERPDTPLRIENRLWTTAELAESPPFADDDAPTTDDTAPARLAARGDFAPKADTELVQLWEYRFADPAPYRAMRDDGDSRNRVHVFNRSDSGYTPIPRSDFAAPGGGVATLGTDAVFFDHQQLHVHDLLTGRAQLADQGEVMVPGPRAGTARFRIPVYDQATMRPVVHGEHVFVVRGPGPEASGMEPILDNHIAALDRSTLAEKWSTVTNAALAKTTYLTVPVPVGDRIYVPIAHQGMFSLLVLSASDGTEVARIPVHSEGTPMGRPPASPPVYDRRNGLVLVSTNAGAIAAVDTSTDSLLWVRRYERSHPFRPDSTPVRQHPPQGRGWSTIALWLQEIDLPGFVPADLVVEQGLVVFAPSDGRVLIALDVATGEPAWMVTKDDMERLIGTDGKLVYMRSEHGVVGIGLRSGLRLWEIDLPPYRSGRIGDQFSGRGAALSTGGALIPHGRKLFHVPATDPSSGSAPQIATIALPDPAYYSQEALDGAYNIQVAGPWLLLTHASGVAAYAAVENLESIAAGVEDPSVAASLLVQAGELQGAIASLQRALADTDATDAAQVHGLEQRLLTLARELASAMATNGAREGALELLDEARQSFRTQRYLGRWHLARIDVFRSLGDRDALAAEREILEQIELPPTSLSPGRTR